MLFHAEPNVDIEAFVVANLAPDWHATRRPWAALEILGRCPQLSQNVDVRKGLLRLLHAPKLEVRREVAKILFNGGDTTALKHIVYGGLCIHPISGELQRTECWPIDIVRYSEYFDDECIELVVRDVERFDLIYHGEALAYLEPQIVRPIISRLRDGNKNCRRNAAYLAAVLGDAEPWCIEELESWANDVNVLPLLALRGLARLWRVAQAESALRAFSVDRRCAKLYDEPPFSEGTELRNRVEHYAESLIFISDGDRAERIASIMEREYLLITREIVLYEKTLDDAVKVTLPSPWTLYTDHNHRYPVSLYATVLLAEFATPKMRADLARQQWEWARPWFDSGVLNYQTVLAGKLVGALMSARLPSTGLEPATGAANETELLTVEYELSDYERAAQCWIEFPVRYRAPQ